MSGAGRYWSVSECGWVPSPSAGDALVTPWSAHGLPVPALPHPLDADDVLRTRRPGQVPGQRPTADEPERLAATSRD